MITEAEAVKIAWDLAEEASPFRGYPLNRTPRKASLENREWGHETLHVEGDFWSVIFDFILPAGTQVHPDFVHIVVDPKTGKAGFLPLR